jgi:dTDP-glucose 4,6-dehydratase
MQTIIVTGGAGFIGSNFVRFLLEQNVRVINLDLLTYAGNLATISDLMDNEYHVFVEGDIGDEALIKSLLSEHQPQAIVNFAAESHVDRSIDGPMAFIQTNVAGTANMLQCSREYWSGLDADRQMTFRFLHVSTDEVYGSLGSEGLFTEETPYAPNSPYSASKAASDHLVRAWFHTYGMPVLTTNCSNNYGPWQFPEKLIPLMILNALEGKPLPIYGDGGNVRDWLYVVDHCAAIWRVLQAGKPGEVYNVGGNCELTNLQVVDALCSIMDELFPDAAHVPHKSLKLFVKDRPGHDLRYAIDASKLKRELAWEPQATFETGLKETVLWYLDHLDWCREVAAESYQGERLGTG